MKKIKRDKEAFKLEAECSDDLWYLSQIIEPDDLVSARTQRKVKSGGIEERSANVEKRMIYVTVKVEKVDYDADQLRISGKIVDGPEDIPRGVYQSIEIVPHTTFIIQKDGWMSFQLERLDAACHASHSQVLVVLMDREEVFFAVLKTQGYELLSHIEGDVQKKADESRSHKDFFSELLRLISDYDKRLKPSSIIVASPSFWKEELVAKVADPVFKSKIILATASSVSEAGLNEILRRPEVLTALKGDRTAKEAALVDALLEKISKSGAVAYGEKDVVIAANLGAVSVLLLSDEFIKKKKSAGIFAQIEAVLKTVERQKGVVSLISGEHDAGKKLIGLGGIAAILRYKVST